MVFTDRMDAGVFLYPYFFALLRNLDSLEVVQGNFSSWWENKKLRDASEAQENDRLKKEIGRLKEASRRTENWSDQVERTKKGTKSGGLRPDRGYVGHKAAKMIKRARSAEQRMERAIEDKEKLLKDVETVDSLRIMPLTHHKDVLVRLEELLLSHSLTMILAEHDKTFANQIGAKKVPVGR